jgi:plastocyanin
MKRLFSAAGLLLLALVLVACGGASAAPTGSPAPVDPDALQISSKDLKFSTDKLVAPAGKAFQIAYDNQEGAPHNIAIYTDSSASTKLFGEEPISGPKQVVYNVPALDAGTYFFRCDLHPDMKGTLEAK